MTNDDRDDPTPLGLEELSAELDPPAGLEDEVTRTLRERGLITSTPGGSGRRLVAAGLAVAASAALVALGFLLGRATADGSSPPPDSPVVESRFALLLYESEAYEPATGQDELALYDAYSRWVAEARRRQQFVTGEDFAVSDGLTLSPAADGVSVGRGAFVEEPSVLSGLFVITATDLRDASSLAESLPHLRRGGRVVIQEIVPTDTPPQSGPPGGAR